MPDPLGDGVTLYIDPLGWVKPQKYPFSRNCYRISFDKCARTTYKKVLYTFSNFCLLSVPGIGEFAEFCVMQYFPPTKFRSESKSKEGTQTHGSVLI